MGFRYLIFNKPFDVVTQFTGEGRTLRDYIPVKSVYPVGRLDHDSEGLVLLTDDGALQHRLVHPRFAHPRTYLAQVEGIPLESALARLAGGVMLEGRLTRPAEAHSLSVEPVLWPRDPPIRQRRHIPTTWVEITLKEGRNRQVRRMTAAVGHPTLRLVRIAIGSVRLEGLGPGEWRELSAGEILELHRFTR